jgi:uncharacterized protein
MIVLNKLWLALFTLVALTSVPAAAQGFPPRPEGPVYDGASIIPDTDERLLDARLREYNQRTGRALVVATVPSLDGETVETYAETLFNDEWGIGGAGTDQGLLLLVAPNEKRVRIETGYGLQEYVTDILAGRIIREAVTPRFKEGDFAGGINAGIDRLVEQLDREPAEARAVAEAAEAAERQRGKGGGFPFGVLMVAGVVGLFVLLTVARRVRGRRYYHRGSGAADVAGAVGEVILWTAINAAFDGDGGGDWGGGGGGGGGGFGGFGGGMSGGGGASGSW